MADHGHGEGHHAAVMVEEEQPSNSNLVFWGIIIGIIFFGSAAACMSAFYPTVARYWSYRMEQEGPPRGQVLIGEQQKLLHGYGYVEKDKQLVRIPIDTAMQKVVEEAKR